MTIIITRSIILYNYAIFYTLDVTTVYKTERRAEGQGGHPALDGEEYHGTAVYRRTRYRDSRHVPQSTTSASIHLEILDSHSQDQESTSDDYDHYDRPESVYEGLDASTVEHQEAAPVPSVYDALTH